MPAPKHSQPPRIIAAEVFCRVCRRSLGIVPVEQARGWRGVCDGCKAKENAPGDESGADIQK